MIVGVISDTHMSGGRRKLPPACVKRLAACELIVHAGDVMTEEALAQLEAIGPPVRAVLGNVDSFELRRRLPTELVIPMPHDAKLGVVHDAGASAGRLSRLRSRFPDADAVVFGHSHMPRYERDGDFQIFNPGSPTERRRAPHHSMGLARVGAGGISFELVPL